MLDQDHYTILNITHNASIDEIKQSYRRLARIYHPDLNKDYDAEIKFKQVRYAYEILSNQDKRKQYDNNNLSKNNRRTPPKPDINLKDKARFDDLMRKASSKKSTHKIIGGFFKNLFKGNQTSRVAKKNSSTPKSFFYNKKASPPQIANISLNLEDAYLGAQRTIRLPDGRNLKITIPKGITNGQKMRLHNKDSHNSGLYLRVSINPHKQFILNGKDLTQTITIMPWEVALGETIAIPSIGHTINLTIPKYTQQGQKIHLPSEGFPGNPAGDMYIIIQIAIPHPKTQLEHDVYQKMKKIFAHRTRE